jgi:hypothetical protein
VTSLKEVSDLNVSIQVNKSKLILRMACHELVLKVMALCPVPRTTNENHKNVSERTAGLQVEFLNLRPHEYEAEVLTTLDGYIHYNNVVVHM